MNADTKCATGNFPCPRDEEGQPIERRAIPWGLILTAIALLASFVVWMNLQERRITTVENGLLREHETNIQQDAIRFRAEDQANAKLQRIEEKLDRIIDERRVARGGR